MLSWSSSSVDEFFASFAYKGTPPKPNRSRSNNKVTDDDPIPIPIPSTTTTTIGGGQTKVVSEAAARACCKRPTYHQSADPNSRRRVSSSNPPSSWIRVTLGDETKVVSKYFPFPTGASNPVVLGRKEVDKAVQARNKRVILDDGEPKRSRQKKMPPRQLSTAEKKSAAYKRVDDDKRIEAPISPYNLLQERHSFDPWRVLIICMLLNVTTGKQVSRVLPGLFRLCPNAEAATKVPEEEIKKEIQSLGIHTKRAKMIKQFSREYLGAEWTHVTQLYGVGKYAADAYAIFVAGKAKAVIPVDRMLVKYWKFVCRKDDGDNSVVPQN